MPKCCESRISNQLEVAPPADDAINAEAAWLLQTDRDAVVPILAFSSHEVAHPHPGDLKDEPPQDASWPVKPGSVV